MTNQITTIVSLLSLLIATVSITYTILTNRDKFVISSSERIKILEWYEKANKIIIELNERLLIDDDSQKFKLLTELSALIEVGRFYFPNIDLKDSFGDHKPLAYRGYKNIVLEFLVYIYDIGKRKDAAKYTMHINILQKEFTSIIFSFLEPRKYLKKLSKNSYFVKRNDIVLEEFLADNPNKFVFYE